MKPETSFRVSKVDPFLKTLENTFSQSIQQKSIRGTADKILCVHGFFIWMEIKTNEGLLDAMQEYKYSCVKRAGGVSIVARPHNWEDVMAYLKLMDRGINDKNLLFAIEQSPILKRRKKIGKRPHADAGCF